MWRRLRGTLESRGYLRSFRATLGDIEDSDGKAKTVLELLKPFPPPGMGMDAEEGEGDEDDEEGAAANERVHMVAERGLDWQIMNLMQQAGQPIRQ